MTKRIGENEVDMRTVDPQEVFAISEGIRYVAFGRGSNVSLNQRSGLSGASSADSDRYEELLVNPAILLLARRRGEIDCGGLRYVVVAYGNFNQLVVPFEDGHVSIAIDKGHVVEALLPRVAQLLGVNR